MEDQCSPLSWAFYYQEEGVHEEYLKHSLLYTTLELETTILSTREELARKDDELVHLKVLLTKTTRERDEAIAKCQRLTLEKLLLQQQLQQQKVHIIEAAAAAAAAPSSGTTSNEDEVLRRVHHDSSSDCDENMISSPGKEYSVPQQRQPLPSSAEALADVMERIVPKKPLPEKGKFLQSVMEAGPLLQTLLLAGPLPQWQHPPPQLSSIDIPPVTISSSSPRLLHQDSCLSTTGTGSDCFSKRRALVNSDHPLGSDSHSPAVPPNPQYQRVVHQSSLTNNI